MYSSLKKRITLFGFIIFFNEVNADNFIATKNSDLSAVSTEDTSEILNKKAIQLNESVEKKDFLRGNGADNNIESSAFNFGGFLSAKVDQRTLSLGVSVQVAQILSHNLNGPQMKIMLSYNHNSNLDSYQVGRGWGFNLTHYDANSQYLSLSRGGRYFIEDIADPQLKYYKLKDIRVNYCPDEESNALLSIQYKDGLTEYLDQYGRVFKITNERGDQVFIKYVNESLLIDQIWAEDQESGVVFNYEGGNVRITSKGLSGKDQEIRLIKNNGTLSSVILPDKKSIITYDYDYNGLLSQITYPTGLKENFDYELLSQNYGQWSVYYVSRHKVIPGFKQENIVTEYKPLSDENYLGERYTVPSKGVDPMYEQHSSYQYITEKKTDYTKERYTYNKFHLLDSKEIYTLNNVDNTVQEENYIYEFTLESSFDELPDTYNFPSKTITRFYNLENNKSKNADAYRELITKSSYDEYGNIISTTDALGVTKTISYCSPDGSTNGCPKDNSGFVRFPKEEVIKSSSNVSGTAVSPQIKQYHYQKLNNTNLIVPTKTLYGYLGQSGKASFFHQEENNYFEDRSQADHFALIKNISLQNLAITRDSQNEQLAQINTGFSYEFKNNQIVTTTYPKINLKQAAAVAQKKKVIKDKYTSLPVITEDAMGNKSYRYYDDLSRIVEEVYGLGTEHEIRTKYEYILNNHEIAMITTDPNGYQVKSTYDMLGRIIGKYRQALDIDGNAIAGKFEKLTENTYDSAGRLVQVKHYDTDVFNDEVENIVKLDYDILGRQQRIIDSDGAITYTIYDDVKNIKREWKEGKKGDKSPVRETLLNQDNQPIVLRLLRQDGSVYHEVHNTYDALGRLITTVNENGSQTNFIYNPKGELISKELDNGTSINYFYDLLSKLV
ncbi:hypothetical protein [Fastidiosibacter lacustris]|uniref:hypothetical protein n=1 Tax=Fastidiosibacter lacustris TaxID=2056695 RepID=UPI000E350A62|nr:hypothetical protein [Fastidiosibacter lacustris]